MFLKRTYPGYSLGSLQGRCSRELSRASSPHFLLKPIRMHISPERELLADIIPTPAKKRYHRIIGIFEQKSKEMYGPRTKEQMRNPRSILQNILCLDHVMTRIWKRRVRTLRAPKVHKYQKISYGHPHMTLYDAEKAWREVSRREVSLFIYSSILLRNCIAFALLLLTLIQKIPSACRTDV